MPAETFRWPPLTIGFFAVGLVFFAGMSIAWLVGQVMGVPGLPSFSFLILLAFTLLDAWALWASFERVETDMIGITWRRPGLALRHLDWSEISQVRERPIWGALELRGEAGRPRIMLSVYLGSFPQLRALVYANLPHLSPAAAARQTSLPMTFRKGISPFILLGGGCLVCLGLGFVVSQLLVAAIIWAEGLLSLGELAWFWHSLTVDHDRIILHALIRCREIPLAEITAAKIQGRMNLVLDRKDGKSLKLGPFKDQTLLARELIESARKTQSLGTR